MGELDSSRPKSNQIINLNHSASPPGPSSSSSSTLASPIHIPARPSSSSGSSEPSAFGGSSSGQNTTNSKPKQSTRIHNPVPGSLGTASKEHFAAMMREEAIEGGSASVISKGSRLGTASVRSGSRIHTGNGSVDGRSQGSGRGHRGRAQHRGRKGAASLRQTGTGSDWETGSYRSKGVSEFSSASSRRMTESNEVWYEELLDICTWEQDRFQQRTDTLQAFPLKFKDQKMEQKFIESLPKKMARPLRMFLIVLFLNLAAYIIELYLSQIDVPNRLACLVSLGIPFVLTLINIVLAMKENRLNLAFRSATTYSYVITCFSIMAFNFLQYRSMIDPILILLLFVHQVFVRGAFQTTSKYSIVIILANIITCSIKIRSGVVIQKIIITTVIGIIFMFVHYFLERSERRTFLMGKAVEFLKEQALKENEKTDKVLTKLYPEVICENIRLKFGEEFLYFGSHVTCISINIPSLHEFSNISDSNPFNLRLKSIFQLKIEKIGTFGGRLVGIVGLFDSEDHVAGSRRLFVLATKITKSAQFLTLGLRPNVRVHTGYVYGTVIGTHKRFELFGESLQFLEELHHVYKDTSLILTRNAVDLMKSRDNVIQTGAHKNTKLFTLAKTFMPSLQHSSSTGNLSTTDTDYTQDDDDRAKYSKRIPLTNEERAQYGEVVSSVMKEEDEQYIEFQQRSENVMMINIQLLGLTIIYACWSFFEVFYSVTMSNYQAEVLMIFFIRFCVFGPIMVLTTAEIIVNNQTIDTNSIEANIKLPFTLHAAYGSFILVYSILLDTGKLHAYSVDQVWSFIFEGFIWVLFCATCPLLEKKMFYKLIIPWAAYVCYFLARYREVIGFDVIAAVRYCVLFDLMTVVSIVAGHDAKTLVATIEIHTQLEQLKESKEVINSQKFLEKLLLSILPERIYHKVKKNELGFVEKLDQVILICIELPSPSIKALDEPKEAMIINTKMYSHINKQAKAHGFEVVKTFGNWLMIAGGFKDKSLESLDQMTHLACEISKGFRDIIPEQPDLLPKVGMDFGKAHGSQYEMFRISYDLWGEVVSKTMALCRSSPPGEVQISSEINKKLCHSFSFLVRHENTEDTTRFFVTPNTDIWARYTNGMEWHPVRNKEKPRPMPVIMPLTEEIDGTDDAVIHLR